MIWTDMDFCQLINKNLINQVIKFSLRPRSNTAHLGPVTGPIRSNLINNIIIQYNLIITLSLGSIDADCVISETVL